MKFLPMLVFFVSLFSSDTVLHFDAAQSKLEWTLNTVLHAVHGTFQLERKKRLHVDCIGPSGAECPSDSFESMPGVLSKGVPRVGTRQSETLRHVDDCEFIFCAVPKTGKASGREWKRLARSAHAQEHY